MEVVIPSPYAGLGGYMKDDVAALCGCTDCCLITQIAPELFHAETVQGGVFAA
jgi:hypothetical protein